jgi:hypothetical protein
MSCSAIRRTSGSGSSNLVAWQIGRTPGHTLRTSDTSFRFPFESKSSVAPTCPFPPAVTRTPPMTWIDPSAKFATPTSGSQNV